jgi:hypothetical protein
MMTAMPTKQAKPRRRTTRARKASNDAVPTLTPEELFARILAPSRPHRRPRSSTLLAVTGTWWSTATQLPAMKAVRMPNTAPVTGKHGHAKSVEALEAAGGGFAYRQSPR